MFHGQRRSAWAWWLMPIPWAVVAVIWATSKHDVAMGTAYGAVALGWAVHAAVRVARAKRKSA